MASGDFSKKISEMEDVTELNKMLDATNDLMERMALEDRLEKLGHSPNKGVGSSAKPKPVSTSLKPPVGAPGKRLSSNSFSVADRNRTVGQRPSMMSALATSKPPPSASSKVSLTPDESSTSNAVPSRPLVRSASQAKEQIMLWAQRCTSSHGIPVKNMTSSFADGVAFCAIVHYYFPDAFNFEDCLKMKRKERIIFAFQKAEDLGGVPQLIDPEDLILMGKKPDYKVMFTYMSEMYRNLKKREVIPE